MNPIKKLAEKRGNIYAESETILNTAIKQNRQISAAEDLRLMAIRNEIFDIDAELARENLKLQRSGDRQLANSGSGFNMDLTSYSLVRAINAAAAGHLDGIEGEASSEIARRSGKNPSGFYVPCNLLAEQRAMSVTGSGGTLGGLAVATEVTGILQALRPYSKVIEAGATVFSGLTSNISIPRQSAASTASWKAENAALDEVSGVIDQVSLVPNRVGAYVELSNQLLIQSIESVETFIRKDLLGAIGTAVDFAAIAGTGSNNQPLGLLAATSGIGDIPGGTDGASPTWAHICALVGLVAAANADAGKLAFLTNSAVAAKLRSTAKVTGTDSRMLLEGVSLLDMPIHFSNNVPSTMDKGSSTGVCSGILFGNWEDILIGQFGQGIDLIVDRFSLATTGLTRIVANSYVDTVIRRPGSFACMRDALTA